MENTFTNISSLITDAQRVNVLISSQAADDLVAGVSLGLSLEKAGKQVNIFTPDQLSVNLDFISGLEKVKTNFSNKDLTIFLDYPLANIEKVSSQEEGDRLKLIVKIKPGSDPISRDEVKIDSQDFSFDVGIVIGDETRFADFAQESQRGSWIWLSKQNGSKSWANVSLGGLTTSYSEAVARIIQGLGLPMNKTIAQNLYEGIKRATNSFEVLSSYKTLETAALCYKVIQGNGDQSQAKSISTEQRKGEVPLDQVENKEGGVMPAPKIFKGATTPRI